MNELTGKTILLISPQAWGKMFISKHHYAIELAKKGNTVFFLNPPGDLMRNKNIRIHPSKVHDALLLIEHDLYFPYFLKFHALPLFHFLMSWQVKKILRAIGSQIDIVWSFDIGNLYPFRLFPSSSFKIFHPVDEPSARHSIQAAQGADIIFSVTKEILNKYNHLSVPKYFINHGLAESFFIQVKSNNAINTTLRVGFSGNLLRSDLDREIILQIISENAKIRFEFWGSYKNNHSNISGGEDEQQQLFVKALENFQNVVLHGPVDADELARCILGMDAFLICYNIEKDQSRGTNYHKVMEFLATGKVIISNNITTYKDRPNLVVMAQDRNSNEEMPALFIRVMDNLAYYNAEEKMKERIHFAHDNSYAKQIDRISMHLDMSRTSVIK